MPGFDFKDRTTQTVQISSTKAVIVTPVSTEVETSIYYNPRLDPKKYLEGPLSWNAATRLRQMLARPGIVVAPGVCDGISARCAIEAGFDCMYQRFVLRFLPHMHTLMNSLVELPLPRLALDSQTSLSLPSMTLCR